jgi:hypothetical protein
MTHRFRGLLRSTSIRGARVSNGRSRSATCASRPVGTACPGLGTTPRLGTVNLTCSCFFLGTTRGDTAFVGPSIIFDVGAFERCVPTGAISFRLPLHLLRWKGLLITDGLSAPASSEELRLADMPYLMLLLQLLLGWTALPAETQHSSALPSSSMVGPTNSCIPTGAISFRKPHTSSSMVGPSNN